jgi:hypothetical protein
MAGLTLLSWISLDVTYLRCLSHTMVDLGQQQRKNQAGTTSAENFNNNQGVMCRCEPLRTVWKVLNGTEGRTRTDTVSPPPDFESGASTNSATPAHRRDYNKFSVADNG